MPFFLRPVRDTQPSDFIPGLFSVLKFFFRAFLDFSEPPFTRRPTKINFETNRERGSEPLCQASS